MLEEGWKSRTAALKLRYHDFTTTSAQKTLKHWVSSAEELHDVVKELLASRWDGRTPIRLVGVGMTNLVPLGSPDQLELFVDDYSRRKRVEETVLKIRKKLGDVTLTKASLLRRDGRVPRTDEPPGTER
jgi:DNA polymerase-4